MSKRSKYMERYHERKARGVCVDCEAPATRGVRCDRCYRRMERTKHLKRQRRIENGLCPQCGKNPVGNGPRGGKLCAECDEKRHKKYRRRERKTPDGICRCGDPVEPGKKFCYFCLARAAADTRARERGRMREHRCPRCGSDVKYGERHCARCKRERVKARRRYVARRQAEGLCPRCGNPNNSEMFYCDECRAKDKRRHDEHRKQAREAKREAQR